MSADHTPTRTDSEALGTRSSASTGLTLVVAVGCAAVLMDSALAATFNPLLPILADQFGMTKGQIGLVAAAHPAGVVMAAVPAGLMASRFGARSLLISACITQAVACLLLGVAAGPASLAAGRLLQGAAGAMAWGGGFSWVVSVVPLTRRGRMIGTVLASGTAGSLIGPLCAIGGEATSPQLVFALLALPCLLVCLVASRLAAPPGNATSGASAVRAMLKHRHVALGGMLITMVGMSFGMVVVLGTLRLDRLGCSTAEIAAVLITGSALQVIGSPLAGRLADRHGPLVPISAGLAVMALVLSLFAVPDHAGAQGVFMIVCLASSSLVWGPAMSLLSDAAIRVHLGMVFAVVNIAWAAGNVVGTAGSGFVAVRTGDAVPTYIGGTLMTVMVCAVVLILLRRRRSAFG